MPLRFYTVFNPLADLNPRRQSVLTIGEPLGVILFVDVQEVGQSRRGQNTHPFREHIRQALASGNRRAVRQLDWLAAGLQRKHFRLIPESLRQNVVGIIFATLVAATLTHSTAHHALRVHCFHVRPTIIQGCAVQFAIQGFNLFAR